MAQATSTVVAVASKPVKRFDYQRLLWNGSGLTSDETLVAGYLAWLDYAEADENGWSEPSHAKIAKATKLHRRTVGKCLRSLVAKGWAEEERPSRDGQYLTFRYRIRQPIRARKSAKVHVAQNGTVHGTGSATESMALGVPEIGHQSHNERRSSFTKGVADDAPLSGVGSNDKEGQHQAPPDPPRQAGPVDAQTTTEAPLTGQALTDFLARNWKGAKTPEERARLRIEAERQHELARRRAMPPPYAESVVNA